MSVYAYRTYSDLIMVGWSRFLCVKGFMFIFESFFVYYWVLVLV